MNFDLFDNEALAKRVRIRLNALGLTQRDVEKRLGRPDFVGQLLRGEKTTVHARNLGDLARALSTSIAFLQGQIDFDSHENHKPRSAIAGHGSSPTAPWGGPFRRSCPQGGDENVAERFDNDVENASPTHLPLTLLCRSPVPRSSKGRDKIPVFDSVGGPGAWAIDVANTDNRITRPFEAIGDQGAYILRAPAHSAGHDLIEGASVLITTRRPPRKGDLVLILGRERQIASSHTGEASRSSIDARRQECSISMRCYTVRFMRYVDVSPNGEVIISGCGSTEFEVLRNAAFVNRVGAIMFS